MVYALNTDLNGEPLLAQQRVDEEHGRLRVPGVAQAAVRVAGAQLLDRVAEDLVGQCRGVGEAAEQLRAHPSALHTLTGEK